MNYLAHLYLGRRSPGFMLGSFLGDFIRGPVSAADLPPEVAWGVRFHRAIDASTDAHPAFLEAKRLLAPERRRFAGILVDIFFDHFLSVDWARWEPDEDLQSFILRSYGVLDAGAGFFPQGVRSVLPRMRAENWLASYGTLGGIGTTLQRVSKRSVRVASLAGGAVDLESRYEGFRDSFQAIFPDLVAMAGEWERQMPLRAVASAASEDLGE